MHSHNITISDAACQYLKAMIHKQHGEGLRITVKKSGCSGHAFSPTVVQQAPPNDRMVLLPEGLTLFLDPAWLELLLHVHIDYIKDEKSGLKQKRLVFTCPKESGRCGCGESFHLA